MSNIESKEEQELSSETKTGGGPSKPKKARTRGQQLLLSHEIFMPPVSLRRHRDEMVFSN
jgi:hypothetical protein